MINENKVINYKADIQYSKSTDPGASCTEIIKQAVAQTLQNEAVDMSCVVNILVTDDDQIRKYNRNYRGIDKATDVLSFPMQTFPQPGWSNSIDLEPDIDTGDIPLGDIIISAESVKRQADEYENTIEYETVYLIIHSTLHLLGYDHDTESNERKMHAKTDQIMQEMGFTINDK